MSELLLQILGDGTDLNVVSAEPLLTQIEVPGLPGPRGPGGLDWSMTGVIIPKVGTSVKYNDSGYTWFIRNIRATLDTPGTSDTIVDVWVNDVSIWTNPVNRIVLGSGVETVLRDDFDTDLVLNGQFLRCVVAQAGAGAMDLSVNFTIE